MPLIQCKLGPASTPMGGEVYNFERDAAGRYVAMVHHEKHAECFISAGTYQKVDPLPEGFRMGDAAPVVPNPDAPPVPKSALLTGTALVMKFNEAAAPDLFEHEGDIYVKSPWPALVGITTADLDDGIADGVCALGENKALTITVTNGAASYTLLGANDDASLYSLDGGSTFETPPEVTDETEDQDDDHVDEPVPPVVPPIPVIDIKGIGRSTNEALEKKGITTVQQLLALDAAARTALDTEFNGNAVKGQWFEQAEALLKKATEDAAATPPTP